MGWSIGSIEPLSPLSFLPTYPLLARWLELRYPLCEIPPPTEEWSTCACDGRGSGKKCALNYITSLPPQLSGNAPSKHILPLTDCSYQWFIHTMYIRLPRN